MNITVHTKNQTHQYCSKTYTLSVDGGVLMICHIEHPYIFAAYKEWEWVTR